ncbi:hypothetical protein GOODEAATRI_000757 [Goodea atripinnis]|uniref:Uncharacterized protein n=1 Tax=Goodea atripinnis TaxID=208336 RepID=A0ABV0N0S7_9TELE
MVALLVVSLLLCLLDWVMALPPKTLLQPVQTQSSPEREQPTKTLLSCIYKLSDLSSPDYDPFLPLESLREPEPLHSPESERSSKLQPVTEGNLSKSVMIRYAFCACKVMTQTCAQIHKISAPTMSWFFQIRSESGVPGGGMTAGLSSAPACVRVIIRDVAGKHSWDSAVLYGPPLCSPNSPAQTLLTQNLQSRTPPGGLQNKMELKEEDSEGDEQEAQELEEEERHMESDRQEFQLAEQESNVGDEKENPEGGGNVEPVEEGAEEEETHEHHMSEDSGSEKLLAPPLAKRVCREAVPAWNSLEAGDDALDEMLQYLGYSSPECLQRAGRFCHLN